MRVRHFSILILLCLFVVSCSVQKRRYNSGYYIAWKTSKSQRETAADTQKPDSRQPNAIKAEDEDLSLTSSASPSLQSAEFTPKPVLFFPPEDSCDVLIFKDGSEVKAKILEVGVNDIKYKRCSNLDGPNHISRKSEIFMIKYANGTKEVIRSENPEPIKTYDSPKPTRNYNYTRNSRRNHPLALPSLLAGSGSILAVYIILIFVSFSINAFLLFVIPVALGIAAFAMGKTALNDIKAQPETWKGKGMAIPGMIMGIIMAAISALILAVVLAFG